MCLSTPNPYFRYSIYSNNNTSCLSCFHHAVCLTNDNRFPKRSLKAAAKDFAGGISSLLCWFAPSQEPLDFSPQNSPLCSNPLMHNGENYLPRYYHTWYFMTSLHWRFKRTDVVVGQQTTRYSILYVIRKAWYQVFQIPPNVISSFKQVMRYHDSIEFYWNHSHELAPAKRKLIRILEQCMQSTRTWFCIFPVKKNSGTCRGYCHSWKSLQDVGNCWRHHPVFSHG